MMKTLKASDIHAIVDSREQRPYELAPMRTTRAALTTGDYSVKGLEALVAVERKSLIDLAHCIGHDRERFEREVQRLLAYPHRLLIIEASLADLANGHPMLVKVTPASAVGSVMAWQSQGLPVTLAGSRDQAEAATVRFLTITANRYWRMLGGLATAHLDAVTRGRSPAIPEDAILFR